MKVGIIDYGVGNLGSVFRALEELRVSPSFIERAIDIHPMDALILPGVGNFADCAQRLFDGGWADAICAEVAKGRPLLGICLGMQLLASTSTEGGDKYPSRMVNGLNLIPGRVVHLSALGCSLRVPHVGWNSIKTATYHGGMFDGIPDETDFYFVHSYTFVPTNPSDVAATTDHDVQIVAAVRRGNVWGTQFHPEKSSRAGFSLLRNFIEERRC